MAVAEADAQVHDSQRYWHNNFVGSANRCANIAIAVVVVVLTSNCSTVVSDPTKKYK